MVFFRLVDNISTLASVFHRVPESFVTRLRGQGERFNEHPPEESDEDEGHADAKDIRDAMRRNAEDNASSGGSSDNEGENVSSADRNEQEGGL